MSRSRVQHVTLLVGALVSAGCPDPEPAVDGGTTGDDTTSSIGASSMDPASTTPTSSGPSTGSTDITASTSSTDAGSDDSTSGETGDACDPPCRADQLCVAGECVDGPRPDPVVGFADCVPPVPVDACLADEQCFVDDADAPTFGFCSAPGCVDADDCPLPPESGDAPAACGDLGAGDTCYLDCSAGQACPDAMQCVAQTYCAYPVIATIFAEDFEGGSIPDTWSQIDNDGLTVHAAVGMVLGVELGDAAFAVWADDEGTHAAFGASYYEPAGTADDWLITPPITLGAESMLGFQTRSFNAMWPEQYEVLVSTNGGATIPDFTANPVLFATTEESQTYQSYEVDLSTYAGTEVRLAFHLTTFDGTVLLIDNVWVSE